LASLASGVVMITLDPQLLSNGLWIYAKFIALGALIWYLFSLENRGLPWLMEDAQKVANFLELLMKYPQL